MADMGWTRYIGYLEDGFLTANQHASILVNKHKGRTIKLLYPDPNRETEYKVVGWTKGKILLKDTSGNNVILKPRDFVLAYPWW